MDSTSIQQFIETQIPLSKHLNFKITTLNEDRSEFFFPLAPNKNHKNTAFGGSLYMAGTLSSYALFFHGLHAAGFSTNDIVISKGEMKYVNAVDGDFFVESTWNEEMRQSFFNMLKAKKKARIEINSMIRCNNQICAIFNGLFVAKMGGRNAD